MYIVGTVSDASKSEVFIEISINYAIIVPSKGSINFRNYTQKKADDVLYFGGHLGSLFTASSAGVYKTPASYQVRIASAVFDPSNSGLRAYGVKDVAGNSTNTDTVYAATHGQGVIKSTDGGQTWDRASEGVANWADVVAVHPGNAKIAYFAGGSIPAEFPPPSYGLYRTEDGIIWEQCDA